MNLWRWHDEDGGGRLIPMATTLVVDAPWRFKDTLPGAKRGAAKHYRTMSVEDLVNLHLPPIADDAVMFFWRVASMQEEALRVVRAWGFTIKSEIVWVKTSGEVERDADDGIIPKGRLAFGMGRTVRNCHETALVCVRGAGTKLVRHHSQRSVFFAPVGRHSEKPAEFFRLVERLTPGPRVELFARTARRGWFAFGDEVGRTLGTGARKGGAE